MVECHEVEVVEISLEEIKTNVASVLVKNLWTALKKS